MNKNAHLAITGLLILSCFISTEVAAEAAVDEVEVKQDMAKPTPAEKVEIKKSADQSKQSAQDELLKLEQTVGESAGDSAAAPASDAAAAKKDEESSKPWLPAAKEYDWVQLTSGEWLKGEIKSMYSDSLEFDSDKLDLLEIDWEDVKYLKSYRASEVNIEGHEPVTGSLQISGSVVTLTRGEEVQEFDRDRLISLTPSAEREADLWEIKFNLSLNIKKGNTEQLDYTSKFNTKRRTAKTRFLLDYIGNISKNQSGDGTLSDTINNHRVNTSFNVYATRYFFYQPIFAEFFRDPFQNIERRIVAGVGVGYTILDGGRFEWNISGGPAFQTINYNSVQPGESTAVDSSAIVFGTDFDAEITSALDFIFKYKIQATKKDAGGYTHHMIASLESEITGSLDIDTSLMWDRISQPRADDLGAVPEPDDFRLMVGVTYTY